MDRWCKWFPPNPPPGQPGVALLPLLGRLHTETAFQDDNRDMLTLTVLSLLIRGKNQELLDSVARLVLED